MSLLPPSDEQRWLLDELATLVRRRGFSTFVAAPVLEDRKEHLPEGVADAVRRLRVYAGLPAGPPSAWPATDLAEAARAVAEEYRLAHGLDDDDLDDDDGRIDERVALTAVYLGFGLLCAGASRLAPAALAFVVAAQQVVRAPLPEERARVAALLPAAQAESFVAAYDALAATDLVKRLGLPRSLTWPAPRQARPEPLPPSHGANAASERRAPGAPVFRVRADRGLAYGLVGALVGVAVGAALWSWGPLMVFWAFVVGSGVAWAIGARRGSDRCSAPGCGAPLPAGAQRCPGCGGVVSGRIRAAEQHDSARARLARQDAADR
jgi:hypothetical protein